MSKFYSSVELVTRDSRLRSARMRYARRSCSGCLHLISRVCYDVTRRDVDNMVAPRARSHVGWMMFFTLRIEACCNGITSVPSKRTPRPKGISTLYRLEQVPSSDNNYWTCSMLIVTPRPDKNTCSARSQPPRTPPQRIPNVERYLQPSYARVGCSVSPRRQVSCDVLSRCG